MMRRRTFLQSLCAAGAGSALQAQRRMKPNVVIILCDDLGYGDLGCYGNRIIETPNLDRLAAQGVRFTDFHTTSPVCSPSRAALITGQYQERYGIHHADVPEITLRYKLPESAVTLAEALHDAGYYTAHVGKWHLGEPPEAPHPFKQGFDYFFGIFGGRPSSGWIKYARSDNPEMIFGEERPKVHQGHVTEVQTKAALEVIDAQVANHRPFFLNLWYNAPHEPLAPLPNQAEKFKHWSSEEQTYFQTVTDIDKAVGQILAKLDALGIADNTLLLFTSDNGPEVHTYQYSRGTSAPLRGMKTQLWEGGIRVPAILRLPGKMFAGSVSKSITSTLDVFPTVLEVTGTPAPKDVEFDGGISLMKVLQLDRDTGRRSLFWEFRATQRGVASSLPMAMRKGRWKLFSDWKFEKVELYNLDFDLAEQHDVSKENPKVIAALLPELKQWKARFPGDKIPAYERVPVPSPEELEKRHYKN